MQPVPVHIDPPGPTQTRPAQHWSPDVQPCPNSAHAPPSLGGGGGGPPSFGGGGGGVHVPFVEPGALTQMDPTQQSPLTVQEPPGPLHTPPSDSMHRSCPLESGTHGRWLQQSAFEAQVSPGCRHIPPSP